ncbi:MAG: AAA family ATPase [Treponemataceae bacterium]
MKVPRLVEERLISELDKPTITILLGPRQVGKSVLLRRLQAVAHSHGKSTAFFDLERPEQLRLINETDEALITLLESSGDVVFVDEFQYLKNATRLFKILVDSRKAVKLVASGSSSVDMHRHLKESLAGRFR